MIVLALCCLCFHSIISFPKISVRDVTDITSSDQLEKNIKGELSHLSPAERKKQIDILINDGFAIDIPEYWSAVDSKTTLRSLRQLGEPFTISMLDALESKINQFDDEDKVVAAGYLYRYSRKAGYDMLFTLMQGGNAEAAAILAVNQDQASLPIILKLLPKMLDNHNLIQALGKWHNSDVSDALLKAFSMNVDDSDLSMSLALQGNVHAIPIIRKNIDLAPADFVRQEYALSLMKFGEKDSQKLFDKIIRPHLIAPDPACSSILDDMGYLQLQSGTYASVYIVNQFINLPAVQKNANIFTSYGVNSLIASSRYLALVDYKNKKNLSFAALKKIYSVNNYKNENEIARIALMAGNSPQLIKKYSGEELVNREIKIQGLNLKMLPLGLVRAD